MYKEFLDPFKESYTLQINKQITIGWKDKCFKILQSVHTTLNRTKFLSEPIFANSYL